MQVCSLKKCKKNGITFSIHHGSGMWVAEWFSSAKGFAHKRDTSIVADSHGNRKRGKLSPNVSTAIILLLLQSLPPTPPSKVADI
jgi:hypothetical protein